MIPTIDSLLDPDVHLHDAVTARAEQVLPVRPHGVPKDMRRCCLALRDEWGRFPIGFCGPDCEGRRR